MLKMVRSALAPFTLCVCLGWAGPANADAVVHWNSVASTAIGTATAAGRPSPATSLDYAKVHAAVHDAVQSIVKRYKPYYRKIAHASGSPDAATAKAAHDVLIHLFPTQAAFLDASYDAFFSANNLTLDDPGVLVGQQAAANIIDLRLNDGSFPATFPAFTGGTGAGEWRPTSSFLPGSPPSDAPMAAPWLGSVEPFTLEFSSQLRAELPPRLTSLEYAREFREVKALGSFSSVERTPEQTDLAYFYTDNFFLQWNRALRAIADARITRIGDSARLFALANMATADAVITAWDSKKHHNFWRPVTAIREGDNDGNPRTTGDAAWQPLINTPNYPEYTSGANAVTGAMTKSLELFFGRDWMTFDLTSNAPLAIEKTRTYHRFSDAARDVVNARIFLGIHFRTADTVARTQGRRAARWAFTHVLGPLHDDDDDDDHDHHGDGGGRH
jgi:hypothetical protein